MSKHRRRDLAHDLVLPTLLFAALGAMTWAIRGCSGFGAVNGCIFAGVTWGTAWWFIARDPSGPQSRPFSSGWIILAVTLGIGLAGNRGWMQWPSFFAGQLQTNTPAGRFVPIPRVYGFVWLFIAGVPWAGLGACLLAWCGAQRKTRAVDWGLRLGCGLGGVLLARTLFNSFPEVFLPLYRTMADQYADFHANPNLQRLVNDNRAAILHLGCYLGFLVCELGRRDWRNATLILTVGLVNGAGWALCQNWHWASAIWPQASFNWWRCWESSGGISIGVAYGIAYYLVNRPASGEDPAVRGAYPPNNHPNLERWGAYCGVLLGLGLSIKNGLKGWANIYLGNEAYWDLVLWRVIGPLMLLGALAFTVQMWLRPLPKCFPGDRFPQAYKILWLVLIVQNVIAQLVTGPYTVWNETVFNLYYMLLFVLSAMIVHHFQTLKVRARHASLTPAWPNSAD